MRAGAGCDARTSRVVLGLLALDDSSWKHAPFRHAATAATVQFRRSPAATAVTATAAATPAAIFAAIADAAERGGV